MKSSFYSKPEYYELAFSFIKPKKQVDLFELFIKKFSKVKVKRVLDIACGPAVQLREMAKRGYRGIGLDNSLAMINYLKSISHKEKLNISSVKGSMVDFKLKQKVDFAFIMMGSIIYLKNNEEFLSHLESLAKVFKKGGLYLIENYPLNWQSKKFWQPQTWTIKKGLIIKVYYKLTSKNLKQKKVTQELKLEVLNKKQKKIFKETRIFKLIPSNELEKLIKQNDKFEFLGYFEHTQVKKQKSYKPLNYVVLRKK